MNRKIKILIADDDPVLLQLLPAQIDSDDFIISTTVNGKSVLKALVKEDFDVILLDVNLPDISGVEVLSKIRRAKDAPEVIMLTADKSLTTGVEAMRRGAYDYITKPAEPEQVEAIVRKAFDKRKLILQNEKLRTAVRHQNENASVKPVHASAPMKEIISQASKVAGLDTTILITGESGTGKDVLARWIHAEGHRREFPLITVNCGALPENLFESEFFGFEKGAFTGAMKQKIGLIEAADGSTLFLDEIGEMPMTMQVKLLNFLESGRVRRVGATRDKIVDVRIIAATNKNLPQQISAGKFRDDLFYRLNIIAFDLPSLRKRMADAPILIDFFLKQLGQKYSREKLRLSDSARNKLMNHNWLGNIRELKNTLERTVALSSGDLIEEIYGLASQSLKPTQSGSQNEPDLVSLAEVEKKHILNVLESADGKREKAASILGITSRTLYRKLKEYSSE